MQERRAPAEMRKRIARHIKQVQRISTMPEDELGPALAKSAMLRDRARVVDLCESEAAPTGDDGRGSNSTARTGGTRAGCRGRLVNWEGGRLTARYLWGPNGSCCGTPKACERTPRPIAGAGNET